MEKLTDNGENRKAFAQRLTLAMGGMTNRALAAAVGVSSTSVNEYCAGSRYPGADVAWAIACFLGVSADWLIGGKGQMRPEDGPSAQTESPAPAATGESAGPGDDVTGDVIEMAAKISGAVFQILKEENLLRDFYGHEFGELTKAFLRIETHFGIRKDFTPDVDSYRKLMSAKKK